MSAIKTNVATQELELSDAELAGVAGGWWGSTARIVLSKGGTPENAVQVTYGAGVTPEQQA
jgi:hypothetical protein